MRRAAAPGRRTPSYTRGAPPCGEAAVCAGTAERLERDETCPVSTEGWTRRVHFVREGGGGGFDACSNPPQGVHSQEGEGWRGPAPRPPCSG